MAATASGVLVYGGKGALGSACVAYFKAQQWVRRCIFVEVDVPVFVCIKLSKGIRHYNLPALDINHREKKPSINGDFQHGSATSGHIHRCQHQRTTKRDRPDEKA